MNYFKLIDFVCVRARFAFLLKYNPLRIHRLFRALLSVNYFHVKVDLYERLGIFSVRNCLLTMYIKIRKRN